MFQNKKHGAREKANRIKYLLNYATAGARSEHSVESTHNKFRLMAPNTPGAWLEHKSLKDFPPMIAWIDKKHISYVVRGHARRLLCALPIDTAFHISCAMKFNSITLNFRRIFHRWWRWIHLHFISPFWKIAPMFGNDDGSEWESLCRQWNVNGFHN